MLLHQNQVAPRWNAPQCHRELHDAFAEQAVPYLIVARSVHVVWGEKVASTNRKPAEHSSWLGACYPFKNTTGYELTVDMSQTRDSGITLFSNHKILMQNLKMLKICV